MFSSTTLLVSDETACSEARYGLLAHVVSPLAPRPAGIGAGAGSNRSSRPSTAGWFAATTWPVLICASPSRVSQTNDVTATSSFRAAMSLNLEVDEGAGVQNAAAGAGVEVGAALAGREAV